MKFFKKLYVDVIMCFVYLQYGDTALHTAARYGHAGIARILISARCNINDQNKVWMRRKDKIFPDILSLTNLLKRWASSWSRFY